MITQFDTTPLRPQDRHDYWQDVVCHTFVPLSCSVNNVTDFNAHLETRQLADIKVVSITASPQRVERGKAEPYSSTDEFILVSLVHSGQLRIRQDNREVLLAAGQFSLYDTRKPYQLSLPENFQQTVIRFPYQAVIDRTGPLDRLTAVSLSNQHPFGRLAFDYFRDIAALPAELSAIIQSKIAEQSIDLLAMALSPYLNEKKNASLSRSTLLHRIKQHIITYLDSPDLTLAQVSTYFGISSRYVNQLFNDEQTTFGRFVLATRLESCAARLQQAQYDHLNVSSIAYRFGFLDMAYFSRVFKARFGMTAKEFRLQRRH